MTSVSSLFDPPAASPFTAAADWVTGTLFGTAAVTLCILAVAFVGLMLMSGRLAVRDGVRVALACFVLLGAPVIAAGLRSAATEAVGSRPADVVVPVMSEPAPLPPANYDPYAGASLRRD